MDERQVNEALEQIKGRAEKLIGMKMEVEDPFPASALRTAYLVMRSPTGVELGSIHVSFYRGSWRVGGQSSLLPGMWTKLLKLDEPQFIDMIDPRVTPS